MKLHQQTISSSMKLYFHAASYDKPDEQLVLWPAIGSRKSVSNYSQTANQNRLSSHTVGMSKIHLLTFTKCLEA